MKPKNTSKLIWLILIIAVISAVFLLSASADGSETTEYGEVCVDRTVYTESVTVPVYLSGSQEQVKNDIINGLRTGATEINLYSYSISPVELSEIFDRIMSSMPEFFFVSNTYYSSIIGDNVRSFLPRYKLSGSELTAAQATVEEFIGDAVSGIGSSWSELEKLMYIHDYLCLNFEYDTTYKSNDIYTFVTEKRGVCQAYMLAVKALCDRVGITSDYAISVSMNHIWNVVLIDGNWYHLDVTWDDATPDMTGRVLHTYMLKSDAAFSVSSPTSSAHTGWVCDYTMDSTLFDNAVFTGTNTPFVYVNGNWYGCGSDFTFNKYDFAGNEKTTVYTMNEKWRVPNSLYVYSDSFSGVVAYENSVYFNGPGVVYEYDTVTEEVTVLANVGVFGNSSIYFLDSRENILYCNYYETPNTAELTGTVFIDTESGNRVYPNYFDANGFRTTTVTETLKYCTAPVANYEPATLNNNGTADFPWDDYYEIENAGQLYWFAEQVNGGNNAVNGKLITDINLNPGYSFSFDPDTGLIAVAYGETTVYHGTGIRGVSGENGQFDTTASENGLFCLWNGTDYTTTEAPADLRAWTPVGVNTETGKYIGTFEGNGKTVSGISFNDNTKEYVGLFGAIGVEGTVKNVTVANSYIIGKEKVGGVCGDNSGSIINSHNNATVMGTSYLGGICGHNREGELSGCRNTGTVIGSYVLVGGVCGRNDGGTISNCRNSGTVGGTGSNVGGVCGDNENVEADEAEVINCYNTGTVSGVAYVGGVCGYNFQSIMKSCYNTGTVSGNEASVGGVCGEVYESTLTGCYYLDTSIVGGRNYGTAKTAAQFACGSVAWLLNTDGSTATNSGVWSQSEGYPVFADETNKAVYKVGITGAVETAVYLKSGESFTLPETIHSPEYTGPITVTADVTLTADTAIKSAQPWLGSSITMIYNASIKTALVGDSTPQMVFTYHENTYTVNGKAGTPVGEYTPYSFAFTNITPQCMGDTIDASLTVDGKTATKTGYSLKIYCDTMLSKSNTELAGLLPATVTPEKLRTLLSDILVYGAASQAYIGYNTEELVGSIDGIPFTELTETDKEVEGTANVNAYFTATGLRFENINKIYWKIAVSEENLSKLSVRVYRDGDEEPSTVTPVKVSDGVYIVYSEDITAKNFATKYRAVITYDGNKAQTATYSVNSYVHSKQNETTALGTLVRALYNYGKSTSAYTAEQGG